MSFSDFMLNLSESTSAYQYFTFEKRWKKRLQTVPEIMRRGASLTVFHVPWWAEFLPNQTISSPKLNLLRLTPYVKYSVIRNKVKKEFTIVMDVLGRFDNVHVIIIRCSLTWLIAFVDKAASAGTDFFTFIILLGKTFFKPHLFYICPGVILISSKFSCHSRVLWRFTTTVVTIMAIFWGLVIITFPAFYAGT